MDKHSLVVFVLVFVFLLGPAQVIEEDIEQNVEK